MLNKGEPRMLCHRKLQLRDSGEKAAGQLGHCGQRSWSHGRTVGRRSEKLASTSASSSWLVARDGNKTGQKQKRVTGTMTKQQPDVFLQNDKDKKATWTMSFGCFGHWSSWIANSGVDVQGPLAYRAIWTLHVPLCQIQAFFRRWRPHM